MNRYARHYENSIKLSASAEKVFAYIDDHTCLSSHMNKSSWMTGGGRMDVSTDDGKGQEAGSYIRLDGKVRHQRISR